MARKHQPYYCEENVWHLNREPELALLRRVVLVLTNAQRALAIWNQRIATVPGGVVLWDYHVILAVAADLGWSIFDLDSRLPCPCPLSAYLDGSFAPLPRIPREFHPRIRIVDSARYERDFASDRSHMQGPRGYRKPAPPWPKIGAGNRLPELLDFDDLHFGPVVTLDELPRALGDPW
ncbi:MAG: hypothetical protein KC609_21275 [Myxococcales bacterium]|nr:hypothetical protein [Myxococcales bacterium]